MTDFLLMALWFFMAYPKEIFAACLIGDAMVIFIMGAWAVGFVFFAFRK